MLYTETTRALMRDRMREAEQERLVRAVRLQRRAEHATQCARRALNAVTV